MHGQRRPRPTWPSGNSRRYEALIAAIVVATAAASIRSQVQFLDASAKRMASRNAQTESIAVGDVDSDGDPDLVAGNFGGQSRLYMNDGRGHYVDETATRLPTGTGQAIDVLLCDVDSDGDLDLVVANLSDQNGLYMNDGSGRFVDVTATHMPMSLLSDNHAVAAADVDSDGDFDLVFANGRYEPQNWLYLNDGSGMFSDVSASLLPLDRGEFRGLAIGDVDADGDMDLVFAAYEDAFYLLSGQTRLYLNDGLGRFTNVSTHMMPVDHDVSQGIALGDVDRDGDLDVLIANGAGSTSPEQNRLYLNSGMGLFFDATQQLPMVADSTHAVALSDLDLDGDLDVVFGNWGEQSRLCMNNGAGRFLDATAARMPSVTPPVQQFYSGITAVDTDADGDPDLLFADSARRNRQYVNLLRQLDTPLPPRIGTNYQLDVYARYGAAAPGQSGTILLSTGLGSTLLPWGVFGLNPASLVALPQMAIPHLTGTASVSLSVPNVAGLAGVTIYGQALLLQPTLVSFTNVIGDEILR